MKKTLSTLALTLLVLTLLLGKAGQISYANEYASFSNKNVRDATDITVFVDGKAVVFDSPIKMSEGRTLVPLRKIVESLGFEVEYKPETKAIFIKSTKLKSQVLDIHLSIGENFVLVSDGEYIGDVSLALEVVPEIYHDRTYVPLRAVAELCEARISWNSETKRIDIEPLDKSGMSYLTSPEGATEQFSYKGVFKDGLPHGFGSVHFGDDLNPAYYKGEWKGGLPDGAGIMKWRSDEGIFIIAGSFAQGRFIDGTVVRDYGYSIMRKGEVIATYGASGSGFIVLPADRGLGDLWQDKLFRVIPKIKRETVTGLE